MRRLLPRLLPLLLFAACRSSAPASSAAPDPAERWVAKSSRSIRRRKRSTTSGLGCCCDRRRHGR